MSDPQQSSSTDDPGSTPSEGDSIEDGTIFQSRSDGQLHFTPESMGTTFPVTAPTDATPLDEDEPENIVPPSPLWAMKERRHEQLFHLFGHPERVRQSLGSGDAAVYVIDDGKRHRMIGRRVGATHDQCVYSLIGRITAETHQSLVAGAIDGAQAFHQASEVALVGTAEDPGVSNIFDVEHYQSPDEVPAEYLPPSAFITFTQDLPPAEH